MKKHFTGIALFIFIIGISGFIASLFNEIPKPKIFEITETVPRYVSKTKCSKSQRKQMKTFDSIEITQMVYQEHNGYIAASFLLTPVYNTDDISFNLNFFVKDSEETRFLTTEKVFLNTKKNRISIMGDERSDFLATLFFESLTKLDSRKNLYVIAEPELLSESGSGSGGIKNIPDFDESKATAVVVVKD